MPIDLTIVAGKKPMGQMPMPKAFGKSVAPTTAPGQKESVQGAYDKPYEKQEATGELHIAPEAVSYRDSSQKCSACEYMGQDGTCRQLKTQVEPEASCNLFEGNEAGASDIPDDTDPGMAAMMGGSKGY